MGMLFLLLFVKTSNSQTVSADKLIGTWTGSMTTTVQSHEHKPFPISIRFMNAERVIFAMSKIEEFSYDIIGDSVHIFIKGEAREPIVLSNIQLDRKTLRADVKIPNDPPDITSFISLKREKENARFAVANRDSNCRALNVPDDVKAVLSKHGLECPITVPRDPTWFEYNNVANALADILINRGLFQHPLLYKKGCDSLVRIERLVIKLRDSEDPLSQYLRTQFTPGTNQLLKEYNDGAYDPKSSELREELFEALIDELNRLLKGPSLFEARRFAQVELTEEARSLIHQVPQGEDLIRLNRLLLAEAYPEEILKVSIYHGYPCEDEIRFWRGQFSINYCGEGGKQVEKLIKPLFRDVNQFIVHCTQYSLSTPKVGELKSDFVTSKKINFDLLWQTILIAPEKVQGARVDPTTQQAKEGERSVRTTFRRLDMSKGFIVGEITEIHMSDPHKGTEYSGSQVQIYVKSQIRKRRISDYNWIYIDTYNVVDGGARFIRGSDLENPYMKAILGSILR
jgi:hypothetical protein